MHAADVEAQEGDGHDEAEHRDKYHPALQHGERDLRGCHQDPDKAPEDLKMEGGERVSMTETGSSRAQPKAMHTSSTSTARGNIPGMLLFNWDRLQLPSFETGNVAWSICL